MDQLKVMGVENGERKDRGTKANEVGTGSTTVGDVVVKERV